MTESQYYDTMSNFKSSMTFDKVHKKWFKCFSYILKRFNVGYTSATIKDLFYGFSMQNWELLHLNNSIYSNKSDTEILDAFAGECQYISDRTSYDRLFRTHWLFLMAYDGEMNSETAKYYCKKSNF